LKKQQKSKIEAHVIVGFFYGQYSALLIFASLHKQKLKNIMSKIELKSTLNGLSIFVTDEEMAEMTNKGLMRFYEIVGRVEDVPKSVQKAIEALPKNGNPTSN
jgi:hypothetical protein